MKYDCITNIIVLGEQCAGKTLFINNYLDKMININQSTPTIGVDFYKKTLHYNDNTYLFKIWDTGNGLLYKNILEFYFKNSSIFIILTTEKNIKFIKNVFNIIYTDPKINPEHIFIIYNKKEDDDDFKFDESSVLEYNNQIKNIYFSYLNVSNKKSVIDFFNQIKFIVFSEFNNTHNNYTKLLVPLNKEVSENETSICCEKKNDFFNCCTIC